MRLVRKFDDAGKLNYQTLSIEIPDYIKSALINRPEYKGPLASERDQLEDPVQTAFNNSMFDWDAVRHNLKLQGYNTVIYPDTMAYIEKLLIDHGLTGNQLLINLASAGVETGGSPSKASATGPKPTYFGIFLLSKNILPTRIGGLEGADMLLETLINLLRGKSNWNKGSYKKNKRDKQQTSVGYTSGSLPYNVFWGNSKPIYTIDSNLPRTLLGALILAYVNGLLRPKNRKDYENKIYKIVKALLQGTKKIKVALK